MCKIKYITQILSKDTSSILLSREHDTMKFVFFFISLLAVISSNHASNSLELIFMDVFN